MKGEFRITRKNRAPVPVRDMEDAVRLLLEGPQDGLKDENREPTKEGSGLRITSPSSTLRTVERTRIGNPPRRIATSATGSCGEDHDAVSQMAVHLIIIPADKEPQAEEPEGSKSEPSTKKKVEDQIRDQFGPENHVAIWDGVHLIDSQLTGVEIKARLGIKSGRQAGMIATIEPGMLAGVGPVRSAQWWRERSSKE